MQPDTSGRDAWVTASLRGMRLLEEQLSLRKEVLLGKERLRLQTQTDTQFALGIKSPQDPQSFSLLLTYVVRLRTDESEPREVLEYQSKSYATFKVLKSSPDLTWTALPEGLLAPYFSFVHYEARRRAQVTIDSAGLRGPAIPPPDEVLTGSLVPSVSGFSQEGTVDEAV